MPRLALLLFAAALTVGCAKEPSTPDDAKDKEALIACIQHNAQNPDGLKILEFGKAFPDPKVPGKYMGTFVARCALLDNVDTEKPAKPVRRDTGQVYYQDGKLWRVHMDDCHTWWAP